MAPLHESASHSLGKGKLPLEGGEEKRVQAMDTTQMDPCNKEKEPINVQECCEHWFTEFADIFNGVPPGLPPLREINHRIPLIDEGKWYHYHLPCCPDAMKPQLLEKVQQYVDAGWWIPKAVPQAAPLLCIPKKTGKLYTIVDCHQWNDNTIKDVTPFPDQDQIRMDVA